MLRISPPYSYNLRFLILHIKTDTGALYFLLHWEGLNFPNLLCRPFSLRIAMPLSQRSSILLALQKWARDNSHRSCHDDQDIDIIHAVDNSLKHSTPEIVTQIFEEIATHP